jgi:sugar transferase (PEP-CTERM system associated)
MRIFNRYFSLYDLIMVLGDVIVVFVATVAVRAAISFLEISSSPEWIFWSFQAVGVTLIVVISFYYSDLYAIDQTLSIRELFLRLMSGVGIACVLIAFFSYPIPRFGKTLYASQMAVMVISLCAWRVGFMQVIARARIHARVLVVGLQAIGKLVAEELLRQKKLGMEVIGFVGQGQSAGQLTLAYGNPIRVSLPIYQPSSLMDLFQKQNVNRILLAGVEGYHDALGRELVTLRARGVAMEDCHSFYERLVSKIAIADLSPEWIVRCKGFRRDRLIMLTKRVIDIVVSAVGLLLSAPIVLLTAVAIKLDSPGPIFYRQERVGRNDESFTIYKFRSMSERAEANVGPVWAAEDDPRVTRVGKMIRKLRIDEIPQMINVLKGEMSLVGPRPERPFFVRTLNTKIPYYSLRHSVEPGITGWAQVCYPYGDSEEDAIEKLQYDLYYIKNMSALFDLQIIFESLKVVLLGKGSR